MPKGVYQHKKGQGGRKGRSGMTKGRHWKLSDIAKKNQSEGLKKAYKEKRKIPTRYWLGKKRPAMIEIMKGNKNSLGFKHSEATIKKRKESSPKRENHYRWIKDRSLLKTDREKMYDTKYKYWMLEVKKRESWRCKINNKDCKGKIEAHHILSWREFPELRYDINNGITLCRFHHPRKRVEEQKLIPFFQSMVEVK